MKWAIPSGPEIAQLSHGGRRVKGGIVQHHPAIIAIEGLPEGLADILRRIAGVCADLSARIARGGIDEHLAIATDASAHGDAQLALDVIADQAFMSALAGSALRHYASEEQEHAVEVTPGGAWGLAIDPLDGSSNIAVNLSIGTIFGIYPARGDPDATFLRPGRAMAAAGYAIYGPQCCLVLATAAGVRCHVLDSAARRFHLVRDGLQVPARTHEFAINASNRRHWPAPVRAYVDDLLAGAEGPHGRDANMRWNASLVAETHRILMRGGVFLYPQDARPGYASGRLRLLYECAPMAFVMECAGGAATDGVQAVLDLAPASLHMRCPLVFGSAEEVARVTGYCKTPEQGPSALFSQRGLFRN